MGNEIHGSALVSEEAQLGEGNRIGPFVVLEPGVSLGNGNRVAAHAVLKQGTRLGDDNRVGEHAVIGADPQDFKYRGEEGFVLIGDGNVLREGVTVHRGSRQGSATRIGNGTFLMVGAHVAHDCRLEDGVILANNVALAGEVEVGERAFLSGGVVVHQFARIGRLAMIGGNSKITRDALPFCITDGVPARLRGLNRVGLRRAGFSPEEMAGLKQGYSILVGSHRLLKGALQELGRLGTPWAREWVDFLARSRRGFHR